MYVETPGVAPTAAPATVEPYTRDLFEVLAVRMTANPALHVVVCTPAEPDYPFGFNPFSDDERAKRRTALLGLPTANVADAVGNRVVAFHTVGFPGRPSRLESTTVIVDDVAALVGSSTLRRRGLTFDGSTDLVVTGQDLAEGRSPAIVSLRRSLQASRLGITVPAPAATGPVPLPSSSFVRLADGVEAFHEIREMLRGGGQGRKVNNVERRWRQVRKDTGLEWVAPHTFRKTVATLISERVDAETASQQLGHSSPPSQTSSTSPSQRSLPMSRTSSTSWPPHLKRVPAEYLANKW